MNDPILKAMQSAIVSMCLSDPTTGAMLGRLKPQPSKDARTGLKVDGDVLLYGAERVKSLTMDELKKALVNAVGI